MALDRFVPPFVQQFTSAAVPRVGSFYKFYAAGTTTPLEVYSDRTRSTSLGVSVELDALGEPGSDVFLQNLPYKVVLEDEDGNAIWTADYVYGANYSTVAQAQSVNGSPNGQLAGTQGSSG